MCTAVLGAVPGMVPGGKVAVKFINSVILESTCTKFSTAIGEQILAVLEMGTLYCSIEWRSLMEMKRQHTVRDVAPKAS